MKPTDTPRTDAAENAQEEAAEYIAHLVPSDFARQLERELTAWHTELSKVMPPDFKDWWQNSKAEWPLVARLVIEGKNRERAAADEYTATIERELAETAKDYHSLAELLDGHDATECRANLVKLKSDLDAEREQVAILRSDEKRLVEFAKTYRARADDLDDTLAAERALADRLARELEWVGSEAGGYANQLAIEALAEWKESRKP